jgi:kinesin family protein 5
MKTVYFYFRRNDNFLLLQAMKVENVVWLKEEFDYKSLCRKLETNLDKLIAENERQSQAVIDAEEEMQMKIKDAQKSVMESEKKLATTLEVDITVHLHNVHVNLS